MKYYEQALEVVEHIEGDESAEAATTYNFIA